jgi:hypothetical protein
MMILLNCHTSDIRILPLISRPQRVGRTNDCIEPILVCLLFEKGN